MEFVLNWLVLLASLGGIIVVALVCSADLMRRQPAAQVASFDETAAPVVPQPVAEVLPAEAEIELTYSMNGEVQHTQVIRSDKPGYIGAISCDKLGDGIPLRYVKILWQDGSFQANNEDWQSPLSIQGEDGTKQDVPAGQTVSLEDGSELYLLNGWVVNCRVIKEGER